MKKLKPSTLFLVGGFLYIIIEILWRGYSHWSMFIVGGICFLLLGGINEHLEFEMPMRYQMLIGALGITVIELIAGIILNIWLGLGVWDYSDLPFNVLGQICLPFMILWYLLSGIGIILDDYLRYYIFGEEKPHYKW